MMQKPRVFIFTLTAALIAAACSGQSNPAPAQKPASAVASPTPGASFYKNDPDTPWLAGPELVVKPGEANILSVTKDEICPLIDPQKVLGKLNLRGTVTASEFTQSYAGSNCVTNVAIGTSEGFLSWGVGQSDPKLWGVVGTNEFGTTSAHAIEGHPARLYVGTEKQYADVTIDVKGVWFYVSARDLSFTSEAGLLGFARDFVIAMSAVTPSAQPALASTVPDPLQLSAAQVCSLMSDDVLKSLAKARTYEDPVSDRLPDSYQLDDDSIWCTRGHSLTRVTISSIKPYDWAGTKPNESGYTTPETFGTTAGFRRRELDDNNEFFKTVATVPWRQFWVEVEVRFLSEGPKLDALLGQEVRDVLTRLNKLVR